MYGAVGGAVVDIAPQSLYKGLRYQLEVIAMVNGQRASRQSNKLVAGTDIVPRISGHDVFTVLVAQIKLFGAVFEAVEEAGAAGASLKLLFVSLGKGLRVAFKRGGGEDYALSLFNFQLEVSGHPEVFTIGYAAVAVLVILNALVPMAVIHPLHGAVKLHEKLRITVVKACGNAVVGRIDGFVDGRVFHAEVVGIAEGQERPQLQGCGRMGILQGITDEDAVLVRDKHLLLGEYHTADAVGYNRHTLAVKLAYVFMTVRTENIIAVLMQAQIERRPMLNHSFVERREQDVSLVVHFRYGYDEQAVLLACVAADYCGAMVSTALICAKHLFRKRLVKVYHQALVEFQIAHRHLWFL